MWSIGVIKNEPHISLRCAKELFAAQKRSKASVWHSLGDVRLDFGLYFNPDHYEHMDFLANEPWVIEVLCRHRVKGDICFGSLDGDNAGKFWGYRFDGRGGMVELRGELVFMEDEETRTSPPSKRRKAKIIW